jgi:carbon monoxide dehydrogenase subunit G
MWEFECSEESAASPEAVWALWSDPGRWAEFDPGIEWARLDGPFVAGAKVKLKPKGGPKATLEIVEAEPGRRFVSLAKLPLAQMRFEQSVADAGDGRTRISAHIRVTGPLSFFFPRLFKLAKTEPELVRNLARHAAEAERPVTV